MVREMGLYLPKQATSRSMKGMSGERGGGEGDE
jgi:hypothetical protein